MMQRDIKKELEKAIKLSGRKPVDAKGGAPVEGWPFKPGTQADLAALIGESQQNINYWLNHAVRGVPASVAIKIERATGVSRYGLAKDAELIWGPLPVKGAVA